MQKVFIIRHTTGDTGTVGILHTSSLATNTFTCPTLELPWHDNINQYSCIPEGEYPAKLTYSPHMKKFTYELSNVPHRGSIRIHSGNFGGDTRLGYASHILGCFLLGQKIYENAGPNKNQLMIGTSSPTVTAFEKYMNKAPFLLNVSWIGNTLSVTA